MALVFLQFALEALEEGKGIRRGPGETRQHPLLVKPPHLAGVTLHDRRAQRDLAIATDDHLAAPPHRQDRGAVKCLHRGFSRANRIERHSTRGTGQDQQRDEAEGGQGL